MALGSLKLNIKKGKRPVDPIEIFESLTLRGTIENIWGPQQSALKEWHEKHRNSADNVVQMNTGGGKTLVGLLMAQSIVNEMNGHVLYVCANNQLVEQTNLNARQSGFATATRYSGQWDKQNLYDSGEAFCITNYHTLFNGLSIFRSSSIDAMVFDDAHVADSIIRSQFTVHIGRDDECFRKILDLYRTHFAQSCNSSQFEDITSGAYASLLFVPMFIVCKHAQELRRMLVDSGIAGHENNKYPWEHIKNNLDVCCVILSSGQIQITPSVVPLSSTPYFQESTRRVYLTATMPSQAGFLRAFGVGAPNVISPRGKAGDAQRLFVYALGDDDEAQKAFTLDLVKNKKACVISPSKYCADEWVPPAKLFDKHSGHSQIQEFSESNETQLLGLVARYDGIDLPGNACRVLILDRLPKGENLYDRFIDQSLQVGTARSSHAAMRVVQAIGRIFRSNTDHGVVILRGAELHSWILTPRNRALLPTLLQRQIQLGQSLREEVANGRTSYEELTESILQGEDKWDELYKSYIDEYEVATSDDGDGWFCELLVAEREAYDALWAGQYQKAARGFENLASKACKSDERLGAWYLHWTGLGHQLEGRNEKALMAFIEASNTRTELGRPDIERDKLFKSKAKDKPGPQANNLHSWYSKKRKKVLAKLDFVRDNLKYGDLPYGRWARESLLLGCLVHRG